jgi:protein tyrosine phosphatase (PTP) superfamily phosphohydrolase (DUF442 family)
VGSEQSAVASGQETGPDGVKPAPRVSVSRWLQCNESTFAVPALGGLGRLKAVLRTGFGDLTLYSRHLQRWVRGTNCLTRRHNEKTRHCPDMARTERHTSAFMKALLLPKLPVLALTVLGSALCLLRAQPSFEHAGFPRPGGKPVDMPGLHNIVHVSDTLYSGGSPEGNAGFQSLRRLGIKTILSVDGARPDAVRAKTLGMRYVHLPIGYDGVSQEQALKLAKAVRDLPGAVYVHCHHGKHRSPAAAAAIQICLDERCTVAQAIDIMKRAGTDARYAGLFAAPKELRRPTAQELDKLEVTFPEAARIPALAEAMVHIDRHWENLTRVRKAGWKAPKDHPDLDPPHEAKQLMEHYRELARQDSVGKRPADFQSLLAAAESTAGELEQALRKMAKEKTHSAEPAEKAFQRSRMLCARCHGTYRDVPQSR